MSKNLYEEDDQQYHVDVKAAVFTTFEYEEELLLSLFFNKIPNTIFEDKIKRDNPKIFKADDEYNYNKVNINKYGKVTYSSYHSKLILYEFDDRLRVIVSSANLTLAGWDSLSQVIWLQDFPKRDLQNQQAKNPDNDFQEYLSNFIEQLIPENLRKENIFRKKIVLDEYDFSKANVHLLGSVNGYHKANNLAMVRQYGTRRVSYLTRNKQVFGDQSKIWYSSSSIGKINPHFLQQMFYDFTGALVSEERIKDRFGFIYPTERYARNSHLGIKNCDCLHLKSTTWKQQTFPRTSFYRYEGRNEGLDRNISHSKIIIVTKDDKAVIDDDTLMYFGSHNLSSHAWGKDEKLGQQFIIANWELGVVLVPEAGSKSRKQEIINSLSMKFPPAKYQSGDLPYFADMDYQQQKINDVFTVK